MQKTTKNFTPTVELEPLNPGLELYFDAVGPLVADTRKEWGLTQQQAAERMGISRSSYASFENSTNPTVGMLTKFARALGLSFQICLPYSDNQDSPPIAFLAAADPLPWERKWFVSDEEGRVMDETIAQAITALAIPSDRQYPLAELVEAINLANGCLWAPVQNKLSFGPTPQTVDSTVLFPIWSDNDSSVHVIDEPRGDCPHAQVERWLQALLWATRDAILFARDWENIAIADTYRTALANWGETLTRTITNRIDCNLPRVSKEYMGQFREAVFGMAREAELRAPSLMEWGAEWNAASDSPTVDDLTRILVWLEPHEQETSIWWHPDAFPAYPSLRNKANLVCAIASIYPPRLPDPRHVYPAIPGFVVGSTPAERAAIVTDSVVLPDGVNSTNYSSLVQSYLTSEFTVLDLCGGTGQQSTFEWLQTGCQINELKERLNCAITTAARSLLPSGETAYTIQGKVYPESHLFALLEKISASQQAELTPLNSRLATLARHARTKKAVES